jgi:hypothetical protein
MVRRLKKDSWAGYQSPTGMNRKTPPPTAQTRKRRTKNLDDRPNFWFGEKTRFEISVSLFGTSIVQKEVCSPPDIYRGLAADF